MRRAIVMAARAAVLALAVPAVVGGVSIPAVAAQSQPCGALTKQATCDEVHPGARPTFHTYEVTLVVKPGEGPVTRTCDGGPALENIDTYVVDGIVDYLAFDGYTFEVVEDASGRPVGLTFTDVNTGGTTIKFHLQCTDDKTPGHAS